MRSKQQNICAYLLVFLFRQHIPLFQKLTKSKTVFVVPAFETSSDEMPETKSDLEVLWKKHIARQIGITTHAPSHRATNYGKWFEMNQVYQIDYELYYEPYVISRKTLPAYSEIFRGYGNDKDQLFAELDERHYQFYVLPDVFVVHKYHSPTEWAKHLPHHGRKWRNYSFWYQKMLLQNKFELEEKKLECQRELYQLQNKLNQSNLVLQHCQEQLQLNQNGLSNPSIKV